MPKPRRHETRNADLIEWCEAEFRRYLHVPSPGFLYATLGVIAANCYRGMPIWLMLVGPSGCGKSNLLMAVAESRPDWFRVLSDASRSAFLSGTGKRDKSADATGGLLQEIANKDVRFIVFKEYGSILDQRRDDYSQISAMQREIWDGSVFRPVGTDGGKTLTWNGKVGELAACTNRIDDVLSEETMRGVRWLLWRYPQSSGWQEALRAGEQSDPAEMRGALTAAVGAVLNAADLEWNMELDRDLSGRESLRINRLAAFSAQLQGAIIRDKYRPDEVVQIPSETYPTRLGPALVRIYLGMERIGIEESLRWEQIEQICWDTAPALRVATLREFTRMWTEKSNVDWNILAEVVRCGRKAVQRSMEDLALLGVVNRVHDPAGWTYSIPKEVQEHLRLT